MLTASHPQPGLITDSIRHKVGKEKVKMAKQEARTSKSIRTASDHKKTELGPHSSKLDDAIL